MTLATEWVRYGKNQEYIGYIAKMDRVNENLPAVLVIQEIWGVDKHIQDITERFAEAGYLAFAPDLYAKAEELRTERVAEVKAFLDTLPHSVWNNPDEREQALRELEEEKQNRVTKTFERMFSGINSSDYIEQLLATSSFLREEYGASKGQGVASVGFCMGGALSAQLACRDPKLKGAVIFYGNAPQDEDIKHIQCPVYGFYGDQDKRISDNVPHLAEQMKQNGKSFEYKIYQNTGHAFFNDTRASYNVASARDAYQQVLQFFHQVLNTETK
ncbi:dienelactone hydrolase family protein [Bacillus salipaludis]|uniref:Dienelactone hydrolase family protein n=1 Tax=Bacillus salipaludis TaxID=2547811 RepID=A0A4V3ATM1_9BACI|nr:dienelactone hydrolase family protein [Bacillus salipaludis]MDQ6598800.1 dienelactone hydrolase family protein [Bacillus salipaludis]TDK60662.1 dienelactone hydrolase family protein [Bacillus salipaludis]